MKEEEEAKQGFIIKDRRRFDDSGEEKDVEEKSAPRPPEPGPAEASGADEPRPEGELEINFSSFVVSLATQALMQLGEIKPPSGVDLPVDVESARRTIDLLVMLQEKTKGNLDPDETRLLEEVLHTLRMSYVKNKR